MEKSYHDLSSSPTYYGESEFYPNSLNAGLAQVPLQGKIFYLHDFRLRITC